MDAVNNVGIFKNKQITEINVLQHMKWNKECTQDSSDIHIDIHWWFHHEGKMYTLIIEIVQSSHRD